LRIAEELRSPAIRSARLRAASLSPRYIARRLKLLPNWKAKAKMRDVISDMIGAAIVFAVPLALLFL